MTRRSALTTSRRDTTHRPSSRRRFGLLAALAILSVASAAHAQPPYEPERDVYDTRSEQPEHAVSQPGYGANAANTQVAAPAASERYRPDEIEGDARRPSARTPSRSQDEETDERRAARERLTVPRRPRAPSEFERYVSQIVDKPLYR